MSLSKLFKNANPSWSSNLTCKIGNPPKLSVSNYFCMWSDLLGFGNIFFENNWQLSKKQQKDIYERLQTAHSSVLYHSSPFYERNLLLNDGITKIRKVEASLLNKTLISDISLFLRSTIQLHIEISHNELINGHPGCRTVLAFGEGIEYLSDEIKFDDYVMNYTKPKGSDISSIAQNNGNPTIVYNPKELQMNTAFSKAYCIESSGSRTGIKGNSFYVDKSAVDAILDFSKKYRYKANFSKSEEGIELLIRHKDNKDISSVTMGFLFDKSIIDINIRGWKTSVYKLIRFYPHDEPINEFYFDLIDINSNFNG